MKDYSSKLYLCDTRELLGNGYAEYDLASNLMDQNIRDGPLGFHGQVRDGWCGHSLF